MNDHGETIATQTDGTARPGRGRGLFLRVGAMIILLYLLVAYVIIPRVWKREVRHHPQLFDAPRLTHTPNGIPGDPLNVALLGSESNVVRAMLMAKWDPADPLTLRSSLRIAVDSVFR